MQNLLKIPVIIDTDIGDDIDDAFALCLAMRSPELRILGVTTVFKDTVKRAKIAKKLLTDGGLSLVPVCAGSQKPFNQTKVYGKKIDIKEPPICYDEKFDTCEIDSTDAVDFIIETLEKSDEKITIITLGALTNIAHVILKRPDLLNKIEQISIMGGAFLVNWCEYNFCCDPYAANIVIDCGIPIRCVGIDITFKCMLTKEQMQQIEESSHPCLKTLISLRKKWAYKVHLHDPLALFCAFNPSYVKWEDRVCEVEVQGKLTPGNVVTLTENNWPIPQGKKTIKVGVDINATEFTEECFNRLISFETASGKQPEALVSSACVR